MLRSEAPGFEEEYGLRTTALNPMLLQCALLCGVVKSVGRYGDLKRATRTSFTFRHEDEMQCVERGAILNLGGCSSNEQIKHLKRSPR